MLLHYWLMGKPTCLGIFTNSFGKKSGTYGLTVIICYSKNGPNKTTMHNNYTSASLQAYLCAPVTTTNQQK